MAPQKWATDEEEKFFQSHSAKYQVCQAKCNYTGFWEPVFEELFSIYPERLRVFKDVPLDVELTEEQKTEVGKAVEHRRQQIMNKFKNDMGSSKVNCRTKNRNSRMKTGDATTASTSLEPVVTSKKSDIAEFIEDAKKKKKREWEEAKGAGVVDHQVYIDRLPGTLSEFFNELQRLNGLAFTVLMGGPTPAMGGQIDVQSFHVGATEAGNQFDQAYPEFNLGIMRPWKEFIKRVFSVAAAKKESLSVWGASRQPTLEPASELWKESSGGHVYVLLSVFSCS
ncbi:hypothetical protein EV702DRAFT_1198777 [Suillus placidus]|uniref:Uncharacterized protein n=1 Tax=Suillus placidus TaxID=48579 RepID=A0A9P6ZU30_9AGAM|nr:hypothetical protein EV702DRAFT_1198777 [Suillus placidus]